MKLRKKKIILLLSLFCISIFFISVVSAKYIHKTENTGTVTAKEFYFKSDILDGRTHTVTAGADGTASINITLMNHEDELRYSETDINYEIKIKNDENQDVTPDDSTGLTGTIPEGKNSASDKTNDKTITIQGLAAGKTYTITAETTGNSYSKKLTGTVKVNPIDRDIHTAINDEGAYVEVTIWSGEYKGTVKLDYCQGLIPDNTDPLLENALNATDASTPAEVTLSAWKTDTSHVFRFFKNNENKNYKVEITGTSENEKKVTVSEQ